jgi:type VI secretion system protein ImpK
VSNDDPFGDKSDRTVMRPTPGGARPSPGTPRPPASPRQPAASAPSAASAAIAPGQIAGTGVNPLVAAAGPLFSLASQLHNTSSHQDVDSLLTHVAQEIKTFEANARSAGERPEAILAARYGLCTLLDEIVLSTPWGAESPWGAETLLIRFHNEAFGGEKFFKVLQRGVQDPAKNLHLIEFMYICMGLGLEGLYRVQEDGRRRLQTIVDQTYETIRVHRAEFERELSPHWRGVEDKRLKLARYVPLWAVCAAAAGVLLLIYSGFLWSLNVKSDPVVGQIAAIGREPVQIENRRPPPPVQRISLATILAADIEAGLAQVDDLPDRSVVTMWALFPSGQARVGVEHEARLARVAQALDEFRGVITVSGHTDNIPIRSLRFPSNWILSERRAEAVYQILSQYLSPARLRFEGMADTKPLVPNDTADDRFINRRVEITLYPEAQEL